MSNNRGNDALVAVLSCLSFLYGLAAIAYYPYFWHTRGATPGKQALGLRVVNDRGENPGLGNAIGRYLGYIVSAIPFYLGFFWILGEQKRGWHDLMAGTYVIKQ
jgi:uncharacterized RDD family membrane protein YckC